jgi:glutathione S-transferase
MKLHHHPASTTSRVVLLFAAETRAALELQVVDLFTGEHHQPAFAAINPNRLVPVLEDGALRLTESATILRYLADKTGSPLYPRVLHDRARIQERMDWVNTQLMRDFAYGFVYPQIFPSHRRASADVQAATLQWARERARAWFEVLDRHWLGEHHAWLCGDTMTIADFQAAPVVALGELVGSRFDDFPHVRRWLARMKALPSWAEVNAVIDGYAATLDRATLQGV